MSDMNVNSQGPVQSWEQTGQQPIQSTQASHTAEVTNLNKDMVAISEQKAAAVDRAAHSTSDQPELDGPNPHASSYPLSSQGGNPWTNASGFVAVLIALSSVASVMARNAVADNEALVKGLGAQYEMGVEAGKMARNAKYAEAMADIVGGITQLVSAGVGFAMAGVMIKQNISSPHQKTSADLETKMQSRVSDENMAKARTEKQEMENDLNDFSKFPIGSTQRADKEAAIANKETQINDMEAYKSATTDADKAVAADKLAKSDGEFATLKQEKERSDVRHQSFVVEEAQLQRQLTTMIGQSLQGVSNGLGELAKAPIKMIEGNYQMWQQIFQTASQVFSNFIQAFTNDMQSHNQMIDSLNQLEQKLADDNTRAMSSHA